MLNYASVPKDVAENRRWREDLTLLCRRNLALREEVRQACKDDILFWLNAVCWTFDPRRAEGDRAIPWVTYGFQDEAIPQIEDALGKEDLGIEKSRTMTATWMILAVFLHHWQFRGLSALGVVSSKEHLVDHGPDPGSLFWKMRFMLSGQPSWLISPQDYQSQKLILTHRHTGSTIKGSATTGNMFRGERLLALMIDEYAAFEIADGYAADAATYAVTNSRIFNSTYKMAAGCFYEKMRHPEKRTPRQLSLPWWLHPEYSKGLYQDERGRNRSPWYAQEAKRLVVEALVRSEIDMDPLGAATGFFPSGLIEELIARDARKPYHRGRIEGGVFVEDGGGPLSLWMQPVGGRAPAAERYAVGSDIGMGTGASNSVSSAASQTTGEKVAELCTARLPPDDFARATVDLCRWLNSAFLTWESNGPGGRFGIVVRESGYHNVYYRQNEESVARKPTDTPGWTATQQNKSRAYGAYISALQEGRFVNRSEEALKECRLITISPTGKIVNSHAVACADPSGAGENHADRPTADALCCKGLGEIGPTPEPPRREKYNDPRTFEGRRAIREAEARHAAEW